MNIFVVLAVGILSFPKPIFASNKIISELSESHLHLNDYDGKVISIRGDWKFAPELKNTMTEDIFIGLKSEAPNTANIHYLTFLPKPEMGSYSLKISSDKNYNLTFTTDGFTSSNQILTIYGDKTTVIYENDNFRDNDLDNSRKQIPRPMVNLQLHPGVNFLVVNYKQKPFIKGNEVLTNAGIVGAILLGPSDKIRRAHENENIWLLIPLGIVFCLFIYSLLIYFSRHREDQDSLVLAAFNFTFFAKEVATQNLLSRLFGDEAFMTFSAVGYSGPLIAATIAIYMLYLKRKSNFLRGLLLVHGTNSLLCFLHGFVLPNMESVENSMILTQYFTLINAALFFLLFIPYSIYVAIKSRNTEIAIFTTGFLLLALGSFLDFINIINGFEWPWLAMWGVVFMSVLFAKNNSRMFAKAFDTSKHLNIELEQKNGEVRELNRNLEVKVKERTAEVRALLEHIPQGVLSIGHHGIVGPSYSTQLKDILGHSKIADQDFRDVFLANSDLSEDQKDQVLQTISCSVDEDSLNFEANSEKLPIEFKYLTPEGKEKWLQLTWNTEVDDENVVRHILVTILDISSEVYARNRLKEKEGDLSIITQLCDISPAKSIKFFATGRQLLEEVGNLLEQGEINVDILKIIFVNMHTLKGGARTLQMMELANVFHRTEADYSSILKDGARIQMETLKEKFDESKVLFERYQKINRDTLGRDDDLNHITIHRDALSDAFKVLTWVEQQSGLPDDILSYIRNNKDELTNMIFSSMSIVLDDIMKQVPKIASDLQKPTPRIEMNIDDIHISQKEELLLRNSFIHILRNAIDHGIESADKRETLGKDATGTIQVSCVSTDEFHQIKLHDDGQGLAIGRLREIGITNGSLDQNSTPSEIADTIFQQGTSTAATLSQISGRGVGMDAIRRFIRAEGGEARIELHDAKDAEGLYYDFSLILEMKNQEKMNSSKTGNWQEKAG